MNRMILFWLILGCSFTSFAQTGYWQQKVDYSIDVKLDDTARTLDGFIELNYTNNSPDTLSFIWFHIWPNAYKNDRTAFSEQRLRNGKTDFYFSMVNQRGYINRLNFTQDQQILKTEDHPVHQDMIKVVLDKPLIPGASTTISTPFHVKLPKRFSRSGYTKDDLAITQWYPKPAVFDKSGWHAMPYLDLGEYYAEFGNFKVTIRAPKDQVIAAGGLLKERSEEGGLVTYKYALNNVTDFAWFASKKYIVDKDTLQLPSGKIIDVAVFYYKKDSAEWKHVLGYAKDAVRFRSNVIGEYPYSSVTVVKGNDPFSGGMEYPSITLISGDLKGPTLDYVVEHEIGHNWFQSALGSNEREHPWMDEGLNTFYDDRYFIHKYGSMNRLFGGSSNTVGSNLNELSVDLVHSLGNDQPVATHSEDFPPLNYAILPYQKTAQWLTMIENSMGKGNLDAAIRDYYHQWAGKHPDPQSWKNALQDKSTSNVDSIFDLIYSEKKFYAAHRTLKPVIGFKLKDSRKYQYINILPAAGFNKYDKLMLGVLLHNYNVPNSSLNFLAAPMYATGSKKINGVARLHYHKPASEYSLGVDLLSFSKRAALDTLGNKIFERFTRISPYARYYFKQPLTSSVRKFLEWRSFIIAEKDFTSFTPRLSDTSSFTIYADKVSRSTRLLNQVSFIFQDNRVLYPYDYTLQLQQGKGFYRFNFTGNYFFNYKNSGGLSMRLFASKFGYLGSSIKNSAEAYRFMPKLMGNNGEEDFTYSNYFAGRTATYASADESISNGGFAAQQIMIRDGGMKMRLDYFDFLQGRTDNWLAAINLNTSLPAKMFPVKLPIKIFFDAGTSSAYWKENNEGPKLLYVGGLQLSLFKNIVNVYAPIIYSKEIRENLESIPELNKFSKRLTFSIDLQRINIRRISGNQIPL